MFMYFLSFGKEAMADEAVNWESLSILTPDEFVILQNVMNEFTHRGYLLTDYERIDFEKSAVAFRISFFSKYHKADSYGVEAGLPPDIEAYVGLQGSPIEFGIAR